MLTPERFTQLVAALPYKKVLPDAVYLHKETLTDSDQPTALPFYLCRGTGTQATGE